MSRFIRHKRRDANQGEIVQCFRSCGAVVDDVSSLSGLGYDLIVHYMDTVVLVEVKNGDLSPSQRQLTESEEAARERHGKKFAVVESVEDARGLLRSIREHAR